MIENKKSPLNESTFLAISSSAGLEVGCYQWQYLILSRYFFENIVLVSALTDQHKSIK
jgi:hypothetical protein